MMKMSKSSSRAPENFGRSERDRTSPRVFMGSIRWNNRIEREIRLHKIGPNQNAVAKARDTNYSGTIKHPFPIYICYC